jgi:hypothetical protein
VATILFWQHVRTVVTILFWVTDEEHKLLRTLQECAETEHMQNQILWLHMKSLFSKTRVSTWGTIELRSALFWNITQRRVVIIYRRFGTTYLSHLQGSRSPTRKESRQDIMPFM